LRHLAFVQIERIERHDGIVLLGARAVRPRAMCPRCGAVSKRFHSRYRRRLSDLPISAQPVIVELTVRRFFCDGLCPVRTFAEQVEGLTSRYARRGAPAAELVTQLGLMLAGRPAARMPPCSGCRSGGTR